MNRNNFGQNNEKAVEFILTHHIVGHHAPTKSSTFLLQGEHGSKNKKGEGNIPFTLL